MSFVLQNPTTGEYLAWYPGWDTPMTDDIAQAKRFTEEGFYREHYPNLKIVFVDA